MASTEQTMSQYLVEKDIPYGKIECTQAFEALTHAEKLYAYHLTRSSWFGGLICLVQTSLESPGIYLVCQRMFRRQSPAQLRNVITSHETEAGGLGMETADADAFLAYWASFLGNLGNYKSFGDSKFVPNMTPEKFHRIVEASAAYNNEASFREIYSIVRDKIFSLNARELELGLGADRGVSTYYSANCTHADAERVQAVLDRYAISPYNTRLFKDDKTNTFTVRQASADTSATGRRHLEDNIYMETGDYAELMRMMVDELRVTEKVALTDNEREMMRCYAKSFEIGSIDEHKNGSRAWIKDKSPVVENYIGFIESYRDPYGVRGEFESFVAVVNQAVSAKFQKLVDQAPRILTHLSWPATYEKDVFLRPDFTSLDIINFASSGIPMGINISNYDDIRQDEGFKNVSLGNVLKARFKDPKVMFLREEDAEMYRKHIEEAFELQVGLHELIGHGTGKLFRQTGDATWNFDRATTYDLTESGGDEEKTVVQKWYAPGETYDSKFTTLASPFEECRAESVGIYLCANPEVLSIFGHTVSTSDLSSNADTAAIEDVAYINWLSMVRSGLMATEFYTPAAQKWRQAHCQARFVILQVLIEAGHSFVTIEESTDAEGKRDVRIGLDRSKIRSVGEPAMARFLRKQQCFKSQGDIEAATSFFTHYSVLDERFLRLRDIIIERKKPRMINVQCVLSKSETANNAIEVIEFDASAEGLIDSFQRRFVGDDAKNTEEALEKIWRAELSQHLF